MLLQEASESTEPVKVKEPHFRVLPAWQNRPSHAERYELFCRGLVRERLYDAACFLLSDEERGANGLVRERLYERGANGWYAEPSEELTFGYFAASLKGRVSAFLQQPDA